MIPPLIYLDRYRNEGTRAYSPHADYTEAQYRYRPNSEVASFRIPAFEVPLGELNIYSAGPSPELLKAYVSDERALFLVHPQILETTENDIYLSRIRSYPMSRETIEVSPSSSTRTLYVQDVEPPHAVKVHFPFRVSRYGRRMRDEVVEQALSVSSVLEKRAGTMDTRFAFMREVLGISYRNLRPEAPRGENWGYLVRDLNPFPTLAEPGPLIPGFALYGRDFHDSNKIPLIFEILMGRDPLNYVLEQIMFPIIRHWVGCFLSFGLMLEPHGQNILLEMGTGGNVERIVYRDLNLGIDNRRRRDLRISDDSTNTYNRMETCAFSSITYDMFMAEHFFRRLVESLQERHPDLSLADFQRPCRAEFARAFPGHEEYLPRTVQYFSEDRDQFGKPGYRDTGRAPAWRP